MTETLLSALDTRLSNALLDIQNEDAQRIIQFCAHASSLDTFERKLQWALETGSSKAVRSVLTAYYSEPYYRRAAKQHGTVVDVVLRSMTAPSASIREASIEANDIIASYEDVFVPWHSIENAVKELQARAVVYGEPLKQLTGPALSLARWVIDHNMAERVIMPEIQDEIEYNDGGLTGSQGFEECTLAHFMTEMDDGSPSENLYEENRVNPVRAVLYILLSIIALVDDDEEYLMSLTFSKPLDIWLLPSWLITDGHRAEEKEEAKAECDDRFRCVVNRLLDTNAPKNVQKKFDFYASLCSATRTCKITAYVDGLCGNENSMMMTDAVRKNAQFLRDFLSAHEIHEYTPGYKNDLHHRHRQQVLCRVFALLHLLDSVAPNTL